MLEKIRELKNRKGFTLVELIVVLVILAILAALLVPALTGYIDKANKERIVSYTRQIVIAAQTDASEAYGKGVTFTDGYDLLTSTDVKIKDIATLAELYDSDKSGGGVTWKNGIDVTELKCDKSGKITSAKVTLGKQTCTYSPTATEMYTVTP